MAADSHGATRLEVASSARPSTSSHDANSAATRSESPGRGPAVALRRIAAISGGVMTNLVLAQRAGPAREVERDVEGEDADWQEYAEASKGREVQARLGRIGAI